MDFSHGESHHSTRGVPTEPFNSVLVTVAMSSETPGRTRVLPPHPRLDTTHPHLCPHPCRPLSLFSGSVQPFTCIHRHSMSHFPMASLPFPNNHSSFPKSHSIRRGLCLLEVNDSNTNRNRTRLWFHERIPEWNGVWFDDQDVWFPSGREGGSKEMETANQRGVGNPIIKRPGSDRRG